MRRAASVIVALFIFQTVAFAQYGSASPGYYPPSYYGMIFTGSVVATNDSSNQIRLSYKDSKSGKTEDFIGVFQKGYEVKFKDGSIHDIKPSLLPVGTHLTVYYMVKHRKVRGRKLAINVIFTMKEAPNLRTSYIAVFKAF